MRGFGHRHFDVCILINQSWANIMAEENLSYGDAPASVGNPDFGADVEILDRSLDQVFCPRRAIHIDRLGTLVVPSNGHQRSKPRRVIIMMMGEEDSSNIPDINSNFGNPARRPVASVNNIEGSIDNQKVRGLRTMGSRWRTRCRSECNEPCAGLRLRQRRLRPNKTRHGRQRGSTRGQTQKISAGKFHGVSLNLIFKSSFGYSKPVPAARKGRESSD